MLLQAIRERRLRLLNCESRKVYLVAQDAHFVRLRTDRVPRSLGALVTQYHEDRLPRPRRYPELHTHYRAGRGHVQRWQISFHIRDQPGFSARSAEGQMHAEDLPPQHRSGGECLPEHLARGLEASTQSAIRGRWSSGM